MKKIKKFDNSTKKENTKHQETEMKFQAKSLELDKEKVGFKSSKEDQEKVEKEFKKQIQKIDKFESFIVIKMDELGEDEISNNTDQFDADYEESDFSGCGCCNKCTGEEGCYCGCMNCKCSSNNIKKASDFVNVLCSESLKYHIDNNKPVTENIFRPGSEAFYSVIKEAREFFDKGEIKLCDIDTELFESTDIGKFGFFNGELVPLDLPMENVFELNEAEYKGKKVKLNHPMRGGSKKYYVYVKNPKTGKIKKISFGDTTGLSAKVSNPEARKSFAARHQCSTKKDKTKAGYWACRINKYGHLWGGKTYPGFW